MQRASRLAGSRCGRSGQNFHVKANQRPAVDTSSLKEMIPVAVHQVAQRLISHHLAPSSNDLPSELIGSSGSKWPPVHSKKNGTRQRIPFITRRSLTTRVTAAIHGLQFLGRVPPVGLDSIRQNWIGIERGSTSRGAEPMDSILEQTEESDSEKRVAARRFSMQTIKNKRPSTRGGFPRCRVRHPQTRPCPWKWSFHRRLSRVDWEMPEMKMTTESPTTFQPVPWKHDVIQCNDVPWTS